MSKATLLVVDDEPRIRRILELSLGDLGYRMLLAETAADALDRLGHEHVDLVLADLQLPDRSGIELLADVRASHADVPVILVTAFGTVETAVQAMKLGAFDYIVKPFRIEEIETLVDRALGLRRVQRENTYLREIAGSAFAGMVAESDAMRRVVDAIERVAGAPTTVLVTGETGVGKEVVARAVHAGSPRAGGLFVALNCAAIPAELLEAELFGVVRGAYTGATDDRPGKFEMADGGTLFLDEIGDMPLAMQAKLLRVLQEGAVERLGSNTVRHVDVRIIAATHRDLPALVEDGRFRTDLFYRLNVFPIHVAPLRERRADIAPLARLAAQRFARRTGREAHLSDAALRRLEAYAWPGNVRELNNVIERAVILGGGSVIDSLDLPAGPAAGAHHAAASHAAAAGPPAPLRDAVEQAEREAIRAALDHSGGNKTRAAKLLGISPRTFWYKLERLGLRDPE